MRETAQKRKKQFVYSAHRQRGTLRFSLGDVWPERRFSYLARVAFPPRMWRSALFCSKIFLACCQSERFTCSSRSERSLCTVDLDTPKCFAAARMLRAAELFQCRKQEFLLFCQQHQPRPFPGGERSELRYGSTSRSLSVSVMQLYMVDITYFVESLTGTFRFACSLLSASCRTK